jgi:ribosomal 50S subunit-recycling heat shock protein
MRFLNKYKNFSKLDRISFSQIPLRIMRFKRPKWVRLQKQLLNTQRAELSFFNPLTLKTSFKQWDKSKNYYKSGIQIKKKLMTLFDSAVNINSVKKQILTKKNKSKEIFLHGFLKHEFRADILLWRLNFFSSSFAARQSINECEIKLNNKNFLCNKILKKGDLISFHSYKSNSNFHLNSILNKIYSNPRFCSFVEVDFYTKTIIIVKDLEELTQDDFNFLINEYFDLKKFRDYI